MIFPVSVGIARRSAVAVSLGLLVSALPSIVAEIGRAAPGHDPRSGPVDRRLDAGVDPSLALWLNGIDGRLPLGLGTDDPPARQASDYAPTEPAIVVSPPARDDVAATEPDRPVRDLGPVRPAFGGPGRKSHGVARSRVGASRRRAAPDDDAPVADDDSEPEENTRLVMDGRGASDTYVDRWDESSEDAAGCDPSGCPKRGRHRPQ